MKKSVVVAATAVVLVAALGGGYYFGVHRPHAEAIAQFDTAKSDAMSANEALQSQVDEAESLLKVESAPFDVTTLDRLTESTAAAADVLIAIPSLPDSTGDIIKAAEKLASPVDSSAESAALKESVTAYTNSVKQLEQITTPSESFVVERLGTVSTATGIQAVTETNDPNGNLNKPGGYTASVYFTDSQITEETFGNDIVDKGVSGGGCVEVYSSVEDAEKRNTYLSAFDGSILAPGSHSVHGTTVIRTSEHLTASQQSALETQILESLIELK